MLLPPEPANAARSRDLERNVAAFGRRYGVAGAEVSEDTTLLTVATGISDPFFNGVMFTGDLGADAEQRIDAVCARYQARRLPFMWNVGPSARPDDLNARLAARKPSMSIPLPGMAMDLNALPSRLELPVGFTVRDVESPVDLAAWLRLGFTVFEMQEAALAPTLELERRVGLGADGPCRRFLGYWDGKLVAISMLVMDAGVAGIYWVATDPGLRGRGLGRLMTTHPLIEARNRGCRLGVLQSSAMGHGVYRKIGFEDCCAMTMHMWQINTG